MGHFIRGRVVAKVRQRLLAKIKTNRRGCWLWQGAPSGRDGRGQIKVKGRSYQVHRLSYEVFVGPVEQFDVLHSCDTPNCINPDHLFLGTHSDNMKDAFRKGRRSVEGLKNPRAKITPAIVRTIRRRYKPGNGRQLAEQFGLSRSAPCSIAKRRIWKGVK